MRCAAEVASIRAEPRGDSEQVTQALRGEPLALVRWVDDWASVATVYDYRGWIRREAVESGEGQLPTPVASTPLQVARTYLGARYEWGGLSHNGIDCSGLVHIAFRLTGRIVPRDAWQQEAAAIQVDGKRVRPGDLVTYGVGPRPDHIAFVAEEGRILHSTGRDGLGVVEECEPPYLTELRRRAVRL